MRIEIKLRSGSRIIINATVLQASCEGFVIKSFIERTRTYSWAEVESFDVIERQPEDIQEEGR